MPPKLPSVRGQTHCPYLGLDGSCAARGDLGMVLCALLGRQVPYQECPVYQEENGKPRVRWRSRRKRAPKRPAVT